ncbi:TIM barrel protein [Defluviimonas sp. SAOS-178_SWC]|uniref:TIM barrel protein n=1 Tax=Defluviimonas sp. SAOS-178_SWC TaxID=3121287 RepID=UPI003D80A9BD
MLNLAINHMTAPRLSHIELLELARDTGCVGVEFRTDLGRPLFDGEAPEAVGQRARDMGLRIVGLSQVYPFNAWSDAIRDEVAALIKTATACGAETISLIPRNDGAGLGDGERQANLRLSMRAIRPMLQDAGMVALIEPLGFLRSSLRSKADAVEAIEALDAVGVFRIVHDTFHHYLAGGGPVFPEHTGIIHMSGVVDQSLGMPEIEDQHRVLVDAQDRLGNIDQIERMLTIGYTGPISMEAFSPLTHALTDPAAELARSFEFIRGRLAALAGTTAMAENIVHTQ